MLALQLLPAGDHPEIRRDRNKSGLHTLHQLILLDPYMTTLQHQQAWFLLGCDVVLDLYAHLICAQLYDTDRRVTTDMAAILEGHTQAISKIRRDATVDADNIYLSLSLLDTICPQGWRRDKEATEEMP